jgi:hypothetical protein
MENEPFALYDEVVAYTAYIEQKVRKKNIGNNIVVSRFSLFQEDAGHLAG